MSPRLLTGLGAMIVLLVANTGLAWFELVPQPASEEQKEAAEARDRLALTYTVSKRGSNLQDMGFDPDQVKRAQALFDRRQVAYELEKAENSRLSKLVEASANPQLIADLCGRAGAPLPPRYAALGWLVESKGGRREVIPLETEDLLERHDWVDATELNLSNLYETVERAPDRHGDATRMLLAAILAGQEQKVSKKVSPWGAGYFGWSWEKVQEGFGVEEKLLSYVVNYILVMEVVTADRGICKRGGL